VSRKHLLNRVFGSLKGLERLKIQVQGLKGREDLRIQGLTLKESTKR
jgi:hypothetical protein